jgi:hypothetical protein
MRTTLTVDDALLKKLKDKAYKEKKPFRQVVEETLRRGLASAGEPGVRAQFKVRAHHCGLHPGIDYGKLNQLNDDLEAAEHEPGYPKDISG